VVREHGAFPAAVVLAGLAGGLLALAVLSGWQGVTRLAGREDERTQAIAVARAFAEAYGTFDFRAPDAYREQLLALTTGTLRAAIAAAEPDPVVLAHQHRTATRVTRVQVTALAGHQATATVAAEQRRWGVDPATGHPLAADARQRLVCRLVREGGRWLVAEVRVVAEEPLVVDQTS
jgi:type II secretory pathway pseudopilin PulG